MTHYLDKSFSDPSLPMNKPAAPSPEKRDADALMVAYGYLWLFQGDQKADRNAHFAFQARHQLMSTLTRDEQKRGIEMARTLAKANGLPFTPPR